jgi:hypothetical protein
MRSKEKRGKKRKPRKERKSRLSNKLTKNHLFIQLLIRTARLRYLLPRSQPLLA